MGKGQASGNQGGEEASSAVEEERPAGEQFPRLTPDEIRLIIHALRSCAYRNRENSDGLNIAAVCRRHAAKQEQLAAKLERWR